jgi:hypothetical protein
LASVEGICAVEDGGISIEVDGGITELDPAGDRLLPDISGFVDERDVCRAPYLKYRVRLSRSRRGKTKIKQCRRAATRYDKLAANYLAFVQLASMRLRLRVNASTS